MHAAWAADNSPVGYWRTFDEVSGRNESVIYIWQSSHNMLSGKLAAINPGPGEDVNAVCKTCKGAKHNQRILGMVILEGLKQSKDNPAEWTNGEILDPRNGKTYHFKVSVTDNGNKLHARGYIGVPLFGRTQTWQRAAADQIP
jgi:uncharacterized protein (DUF2147 family)